MLKNSNEQNKYIILRYTLAVVTTHDKSPRWAAMMILKLLMIELSFRNLPFSANKPNMTFNHILYYKNNSK